MIMARVVLLKPFPEFLAHPTLVVAGIELADQHGIAFSNMGA
jgi:hypothetical protein